MRYIETQQKFLPIYRYNYLILKLQRIVNSDLVQLLCKLTSIFLVVALFKDVCSTAYVIHVTLIVFVLQLHIQKVHPVANHALLYRTETQMLTVVHLVKEFCTFMKPQYSVSFRKQLSIVRHVERQDSSLQLPT